VHLIKGKHTKKYQKSNTMKAIFFAINLKFRIPKVFDQNVCTRVWVDAIRVGRVRGGPDVDVANNDVLAVKRVDLRTNIQTKNAREYWTEVKSYESWIRVMSRG
jgi:hypothetical protein